MSSRFTAIRLVAMREIAARWFLWPVVILLATIAITIPRLVAVEDQLVAADTTWISVVGLSMAVACMVGMSLLGNELADSRLSFYFTRPFASWEIFAGKLAGGTVLALVSQAILVVLAGLTLPGPDRLFGVGCTVVVATVASVAIGIAAGVAARSRTRWLAVDVAGLAIVGVAIAVVAARVTRVHDRMYQLGIDDGGRLSSRISIVGLAFVLVVLAGLSVAGTRALSTGRTDRTRVHAVMSRTLWSIVMPATGVAMAVVWGAS